MRRRLRARPREQEGFTLIELTVVVLVIGILIAIGLPTYVGAQTRAENRAAQTDVRSGLVTAMTYYTGGATYTGFNVAAAQVAEPDLSWVPGGAPPAIGQIAIEVANGDQLLLITQARNGTYWCVAQVSGSPLTQRGGDANWVNVNTTASCNQGW